MPAPGDTIFALASARGKAGIAVFRLSGAAAHTVAADLCGELPPPRRASVRALKAEGELIDEALVLVFERGASFTGEDVAEFHVHGSVAVVRRLESVLARSQNCRLADPGEFTRRALENGRLDLTQVEGLADLISAETEAQLRQAQRALGGEFGRKVEAWREQLVQAAALIEASIDFSDEDLPESLAVEARAILHGVLAEWRKEAAGAQVAERLRDGFEVALVGAPNTGKSTLINAIANREVAITSATPGTTRDVLEVRVELGGLPVTLLDTAGVRQSDDEIESIGVARTRARAKQADLRLYLDESAELYGLPVLEGDLRLHGKCDLGRGAGLNVSGKTGEGLAEMLQAVRTELEGRVASSGLATRERHRAALDAASRHVETAAYGVGSDHAEIVAEELRAARHHLDVLVGRVDVEEILGHIFSSFCIGK